MTQFSALLGKRVDVLYRAGEIYLPASATLVADTGKSIFLEECIHHRERVRTFRWEIPYQHIMRLHESLSAAASSVPPGAGAAAASAPAPHPASGLSVRPVPEKAGV